MSGFPIFTKTMFIVVPMCVVVPIFGPVVAGAVAIVALMVISQ